MPYSVNTNMVIAFRRLLLVADGSFGMSLWCVLPHHSDQATVRPVSVRNASILTVLASRRIPVAIIRISSSPCIARHIS